MTDEARFVPELYALIGSAVTEMIMDNRAFEAHDITLVLHTRRAGTRDVALQQQYDAAIRLLAGLMH